MQIANRLRRSAALAAAGVLAAIGLTSPAAADTTNSQEISRELVPAKVLEGPYRMTNVQTGRCLESNYSGHVYTTGCSNSSYQGWIWETHPSYQGWWRVKNWQTNQCLDGSDGRVYTLACNGGRYQLWGTPNGNDGHISHRGSFSGRLDSNYDGSVYLHEPNNSNHQRWQLSWL